MRLLQPQSDDNLSSDHSGSFCSAISREQVPTHSSQILATGPVIIFATPDCLLPQKVHINSLSACSCGPFPGSIGTLSISLSLEARPRWGIYSASLRGPCSEMILISLSSRL